MSKDDLPASSASALSERAFDELGGRRPETVAAYDNPVMAEMARSRLEAEGVVARLADEHTIGVAGHLATAIGGVKVQVAEEDAGYAREILDSMGEIEFDTPDEDEHEPPEELATQKRPDALVETAPNATRALRAAVFSFFISPLVLLSLYYALRYATGDEEGGRGKVTVAVFLDVLLVGLYALMFVHL